MSVSLNDGTHEMFSDSCYTLVTRTCTCCIKSVRMYTWGNWLMAREIQECWLHWGKWRLLRQNRGTWDWNNRTATQWSPKSSARLSQESFLDDCTFAGCVQPLNKLSSRTMVKMNYKMTRMECVCVHVYACGFKLEWVEKNQIVILWGPSHAWVTCVQDKLTSALLYSNQPDKLVQCWSRNKKIDLLLLALFVNGLGESETNGVFWQ